MNCPINKTEPQCHLCLYSKEELCDYPYVGSKRCTPTATCNWFPWKCVHGRAQTSSWDRACLKEEGCIHKIECHYYHAGIDVGTCELNDNRSCKLDL